MEKKDSIFARLNPPAPPPAQPRPAEPRPDAAELEAAALKRKMDAMEKNLVAQLEKKITDLLTAAPAKRPDADSAALAARIAELDKRLEEFARNAVTSSVQLKNIEESKISARREIEDLLKVVREQQKYTEMDREMHDQLAKSWIRAEELEKKLMDFCGTVLIQKNQGAPAPAAPAPAAAPDERPGLEELRQGMLAELAKTREETLALAREQAEAFKAMFEEQVKGRLDLVQGAVAAELERSRKETAAGLEQDRRRIAAELEQDRRRAAAELEQERRQAAAEMELLKKELAGQLKAMQSMLDNFGRGVQEKLSAAEDAAADASRHAADAASLLGQKLDRLGGILKNEGDKTLAGVEESNNRCFEALNKKYAEALASASSLNFIASSADAAARKMDSLERALAALVSGTDKDRLASALGVSGLLVRQNFEAMETLLAGLKEDSDGLERIKKDVEARLKDIFRGDGK
jgi:hypothetical protein